MWLEAFWPYFLTGDGGGDAYSFATVTPKRVTTYNIKYKLFNKENFIGDSILEKGINCYCLLYRNLCNTFQYQCIYIGFSSEYILYLLYCIYSVLTMDHWAIGDKIYEEVY